MLLLIKNLTYQKDMSTDNIEALYQLGAFTPEAE
ncbi:MAG: Uncharacterised protein [Synechococcus sp. CC9902]|nr:MAG: Uncharacterised protein [Synechococcus sp. CC9902]